MKFFLSIPLIIIYLFLSSHTAIANNKPAILFFSSNNTHVITLNTAYQRLTGKEQKILRNEIANFMQRHQIKSGTMENILGAYQMVGTQNMTADNTDIFKTSPDQRLSKEKIFILAKQLATTLNQESVAVFIPNQKNGIGDVTVRFVSHQPTIIEMINVLRAKLSPSYRQSFSLHLNNEGVEFKHVKIAEIEWLGNKAKLNEIQKAFPQQKISYYYGAAYLIYKNGKKVQL